MHLFVHAAGVHQCNIAGMKPMSPAPAPYRNLWSVRASEDRHDWPCPWLVLDSDGRRRGCAAEMEDANAMAERGEQGLPLIEP